MTLTTIPSRISRIRPVIESLEAQTRPPARIYVCICEWCLRENAGYEVPDWLGRDELVQVVVAAKDYGPATKLIGMLDQEPDPSTRIVIVDDDWAYEPNMVEALEERFEESGNAAIGSSGARLPRRWTEMVARIGPEIEAKPQLRHQLVFIAEAPEDLHVDILQFGFGAIVLRGWFDDDLRDLVKPLEPLFFADDVLFSGYLESRGVPRVCISGMKLPRLLDHWNVRPLHGDGRATRNYRAAIPELAARLSIWSPEDLFEPRPPLRAVLRHLLLRMLYRTYRVTLRPLVTLARSAVARRGQ